MDVLWVVRADGQQQECRYADGRASSAWSLDREQLAFSQALAHGKSSGLVPQAGTWEM